MNDSQKSSQKWVPYPQEMRKCNSLRREMEWDKHSWIYRLVTFIPFHIYDAIMAEIESHFCYDCAWCGRQYFSSKKSLECCADVKRLYGRSPYMLSYTSCGGGYGGASSIDYNYHNDTCYNRDTGKTYH